MQRTADFHHHVANPRFPHPDRLFEHAAAFNAAVDRFDAHAPPRDVPIPGFLRSRQLVPTGLLRRLEDVHPVEREGLKPEVLQQLTPHGQGLGRGIGDALVVDTARMRLTQEEDTQSAIDQQEIVQHVPLCLAALTRFLFSRILRARAGSLGAIMTKRGGAGGGAVGTSSAGDAASGREAPAIARRARKAST
jgi:hypothetical protein